VIAHRNANWTTIVHSQRRETNSRQPSLSSRSRWEGSAGGKAGKRMPARSAAARAKLAASAASPQPGPYSATNRVYDGYLAELAQTKPDDLAVSAVSIIGPRNKISKLVQNLSLLH